MFEKIGKIFTAIVAGIVALVGIFLSIKHKKNSDLDASFDRAKKEFIEKNGVIVDDHEKAIQKINDEYNKAFEDLSQKEERDLEELREKYDSEIVDIYERNRENPEGLAEELSKKYGLKNV